MAVKVPSPNYWTARELPTTVFLTFTFKHKKGILKLFIHNEQKAPPPPKKDIVLATEIVLILKPLHM